MNPFRNDKKRGTTSSEGLMSPANYHSFPDQPQSREQQADNNHDAIVTIHSSQEDYRGFHTSIYDVYSSPDNERVDCCAMTCCGILQHDRDRYLIQGKKCIYSTQRAVQYSIENEYTQLPVMMTNHAILLTFHRSITGTTPPDLFKRFVVHFLTPLSIFLVAGLVATHVSNKQVNQILCWVLVGMLILYATLQAYKWRSKTMAVRKDILWLKYQLSVQEQQNTTGSRKRNRTNVMMLLEQQRSESRDEDDDEDKTIYLGQTRWDLACAHPCCIVGCYRNDRSIAAANQYNEESDEDSNNLCSCMWSHLCLPLCCGKLLLQCCGVCALAQEAREIESVLFPASYRRIDYVTMQAMVDYYPAIYRARWYPHEGNQTTSTTGTTRSWWSYICGCCCRPPPLSRLSIRLLQSVLALTTMLLVWSVAGPYYWRYVVGRRNKVHTFGIYSFLVFVAAWIQTIGLLVLIVWFVNKKRKTTSELSTDALIKFIAAGFFLSTSLAVFWELVCSLILKVFVSLILLISGVNAVSDPEDVEMSWMKLGFGASFVPDDRLRLTSASSFLQAFGNDHPVFYTFYIFVTAFFLAAFIEELCKYFGFRMVEHPDFLSRRDLNKASRVVMGENDGQEETEELDDEDDEEEEYNTALESVMSQTSRSKPPSYSNQRQSIQGQATAIMLAMIAVAMGFTCCENLVYLFVYSKGSVQMQLTVLISRSLFPVHPIAAAIQSIGVCRRELEGDKAVTGRLGRIILPAVVFHGGYDFFILWIDFLATRHGTYANKDDDGSSSASDDDNLTAVAVSFAVSVLSICLALYYLWIEGTQQRERLADMDHRIATGHSRLL